jgi:hypothetical protein
MTNSRWRAVVVCCRSSEREAVRMMSSTYNNRYTVSHKAQEDQVGSEAVVPSPRHRLQAEEGLVEPTHQLWVSGVNEAGGLALGDFVSEGAVEEDVLNIQVVNKLSPRETESQNSVDGSGLHHKSESLVVVHIGALGEPSEDPTSFVLV